MTDMLPEQSMQVLLMTFIWAARYPRTPNLEFYIMATKNFNALETEYHRYQRARRLIVII
jgi:hypothetical protein